METTLWELLKSIKAGTLQYSADSPAVFVALSEANLFLRPAAVAEEIIDWRIQSAPPGMAELAPLWLIEDYVFDTDLPEHPTPVIFDSFDAFLMRYS